MPSRLARLDDPESLRGFVKGLREGIYITNPRGEILDANPAFLEMLGVGSVAELRAARATDFVDPELRKRELELIAREGGVREFEFEVRRKDGQRRTVIDSCTACTDPETGEIFYHGILIDITERKRLEQALHEQSLRDPLTGCYNRRFITQFARDHEGTPETWGCLVVDLDHFKQYNDEFGHEAGDEVLNKTARFLMRQSRAEEAVVRMGGDEFLLLLEEVNEKATAAMAERLRFMAGKEMLAPFSLGWAYRLPGEKLEKTIHRADLDLFASRRSGPRGGGEAEGPRA
jgi:diguanylate cyclase (GGDEF)-like protein/PAS domain S-box-containing protein